METYRLVETQDLAAIERIEAEHEKRRNGMAAAAAAALRRAGWLRAGIGAGAAATGIGLGGLLLCWGLSLLLGRPTLQEVGAALIDQAAAIERRTGERVEAARREAEAMVASAQQAAREAEQRARTAEQVAAEKTRAADRAAAEVREIVKKFESAKAAPAAGGKATKSVVDFSFFHHHELGSLVVTTGWTYQQLSDAAPSHQWCYVRNIAVRDGLDMTIASDGKPVTGSARCTSAAVRPARSGLKLYLGEVPGKAARKNQSN